MSNQTSIKPRVADKALRASVPIMDGVLTNKNTGLTGKGAAQAGSSQAKAVGSAKCHPPSEAAKMKAFDQLLKSYGGNIAPVATTSHDLKSSPSSDEKIRDNPPPKCPPSKSSTGGNIAPVATTPHAWKGPSSSDEKIRDKPPPEYPPHKSSTGGCGLDGTLCPSLSRQLCPEFQLAHDEVCTHLLTKLCQPRRHTVPAGLEIRHTGRVEDRHVSDEEIRHRIAWLREHLHAVTRDSQNGVSHRIISTHARGQMVRLTAE